MHCLREAISCYHKLTPSVVSEKNWNTKETKCNEPPHFHLVFDYWGVHSGAKLLMHTGTILSFKKVNKQVQGKIRNFNLDYGKK